MDFSEGASNSPLLSMVVFFDRILPHLPPFSTVYLICSYSLFSNSSEPVGLIGIFGKENFTEFKNFGYENPKEITPKYYMIGTRWN